MPLQTVFSDTFRSDRSESKQAFYQRHRAYLSIAFFLQRSNTKSIYFFRFISLTSRANGFVTCLWAELAKVRSRIQSNRHRNRFANSQRVCRFGVGNGVAVSQFRLHLYRCLHRQAQLRSVRELNAKLDLVLANLGIPVPAIAATASTADLPTFFILGFV